MLALGCFEKEKREGEKTGRGGEREVGRVRDREGER